MNTTLRFLSLISLLVLAMPGRAQDGAAWSKFVNPSPTIHPTEFVNFNVDFPGGPISQLLATLAKIDGISLNIIGVGEAADFARVELPAFSLRNVNIIAVSEVLRNFLEPRGFELRPVGGSANANTMVLTLKRNEAKVPKQAPAMFQSFRLYPYLQAQTVDDIVGAIRAGWELDPAHDPKALNLKFHPGTSILLVSGSTDAIMVTQSVIGQLKRNPEVLPKPEQKSPPAPGAEKK